MGHHVARPRGLGADLKSHDPSSSPALTTSILVFPRPIDVEAWPVQRKFSRCRKVQKACNEHRDPFKKCKLGVVCYIQRCDEYEGVESESRASRIKIYDTFDRSAVKIHRRAFFSCSRVKAGNFSGFVNNSSETLLKKLSPLNELRNSGNR